MPALVLGLSSAAAWGLADFLGGLKSRTVAVVTVALVSQACGAAIAVLWAGAIGEPAPAGRVLAYAVLAGVINTTALLAFFRALAVGTMSIVAPIVGTSAVLPVLTGIAYGERPSPLESAGIVVAVVGVVLASRRLDELPTAGRARDARLSLALALVAALAVGGNLVVVEAAVNAVPDAPIVSTLAVSRGVAMTLLLATAAALFLRRRGGRTIAPRRADLAPIALVGALDLLANVLYANATREGLLSVVAVLVSLHPVATVLLAHALLGERIRRLQRAGVGFAIAGAALVGSG